MAGLARFVTDIRKPIIRCWVKNIMTVGWLVVLGLTAL